MINFLKKILILLISPLPPVEHNGYQWDDRLNFMPRILKLIIDLKKLIFTHELNFHYIKIYLISLLNFFKHSIIIFLNFFFFPIVFFLYILNYRFLNINQSQIGACIHQLDTLVKHNKLFGKKKLIILKIPLQNQLEGIVKLYKNEVLILNNPMFYFFFYSFSHSVFLKIDTFMVETHNKNSKFNYTHKKYLEKFKSNLVNINKGTRQRIITIHLRDNVYGGSNYRNANIENYIKTINFLLKNNYKIYRFINLSSKKLKIKNNNYREMLVNINNIDKQIKILGASLMVICNQSGPVSFNLISDTTYVLTNAVPINNIMVVKKNDKFIFKSFFYKKKNKYLNLNEIKTRKLHLNPDKIKHFKIKIIENNENEILNVVKEGLSKKKLSNKNKKKFAHKFKIFNSRHTDATTSDFFLNKNKY